MRQRRLEAVIGVGSIQTFGDQGAERGGGAGGVERRLIRKGLAGAPGQCKIEVQTDNSGRVVDVMVMIYSVGCSFQLQRHAKSDHEASCNAAI